MPLTEVVCWQQLCIQNCSQTTANGDMVTTDSL